MNRLYDCIVMDVPKAPNISDVIFSDDPSSEFKNKYAMKLLAIVADKVNGKAAWKYFATSHGKGVVDGIGGRAKLLVRQKTMSKGDDVIVQSSEDFATLVAQLMPSTIVHHVSQADIDCATRVAQPWADVVTVTGIRDMHAAEYSPDNHLLKM